MNGYVEAGYIVGLGTLLTYAGTLVGRERAARRRLADGDAASRRDAPAESGDVAGDGR